MVFGVTPEVPTTSTSTCSSATTVSTRRWMCSNPQGWSWTATRPDAPTIVPIVGVRTAEQLTDNLGALAVSLTSDDVARLDGALPLELGFPRSFLESSDVRELIYGDTWARLRTA